eukprot:2804290-Amphidinium_carterae.2
MAEETKAATATPGATARKETVGPTLAYPTHCHKGRLTCSGTMAAILAAITCVVTALCKLA